jgi:hypothetical protein
MIQQGTRQYYNFEILKIIEKNITTNKLIIEDLESVMKRLKISNLVGDLRSLSSKSDREYLEDLKLFFAEFPDMRFLQGLINLGFVEDSLITEWVEESVQTYTRVKENE